MHCLPCVQNAKLLSSLSTFGIGGHARYFVEVRTIDDMQNALRYCYDHNERFLIIGKGSNCLFDDRGFNGLVILNKIDFMTELSPGMFHVGAGYSFSLLGTQIARNNWSGLEFASGIPGSVGGAIFMNAGANGAETCETLFSVDFLDNRGALHVLKREELHFSYRTSSFQKMRGAIVGATFSLRHSLVARQKQLEIIGYRKRTQPYNAMSAGCIFRNPVFGHAGAFIEECNLKGVQVGDAKVSEVHANFLINMGNATAKDILALIELIKKTVKLNKGIELESEVRVIPYE